MYEREISLSPIWAQMVICWPIGRPKTSFRRGSLNRYLHQRYTQLKYIAVFGETIVFSSSSNSCNTSGLSTFRGPESQSTFSERRNKLCSRTFNQTSRVAKIAAKGSHCGLVIPQPTSNRAAGMYISFLASK